MFKLQKIAQLAVTFAVWFVVVTVIHELGHSLYAQAVHGCGDVTIRMDAFWSGMTYTCYDAVRDQGSWMAGGLFASLVCLVLWGLARWSPTKWDLGDEFVFAVFAALQFSLGITEPTVHFQPDQAAVVRPVLAAAFMFPVLFYYSWRWAKWYKED